MPPLKLGMGSARPQSGPPDQGKPLESTLVENPWANKPFPRGSIVQAADGHEYRVIGMASNGEERVIEAFADGRRRVVKPRELALVEPAPPPPGRRPDPPARVRPSSPEFDDQARLEAHRKVLAERYGDQTGRWGRDGAMSNPSAESLEPGGPNIVNGDFDRSMFPAFEAEQARRAGRPSPTTETVALEGGLYSGRHVDVARGADSHSVPVAAGGGYGPATYYRTDRRTEDGAVIFALEPEPAATIAAAAG